MMSSNLKSHHWVRGTKYHGRKAVDFYNLTHGLI